MIPFFFLSMLSVHPINCTPGEPGVTDDSIFLLSILSIDTIECATDEPDVSDDSFFLSSVLPVHTTDCAPIESDAAEDSTFLSFHFVLNQLKAFCNNSGTLSAAYPKNSPK